MGIPAQGCLSLLWQQAVTVLRRIIMLQMNGGHPYDTLGSNSNAMAVRSAPMFGYYDKEDEAVQAAKTAMFTHKEQSTRETTDFFTRVTFRVIHKGLTPEEAIKEVAKVSSQWVRKKVRTPWGAAQGLEYDSGGQFR